VLTLMGIIGLPNTNVRIAQNDLNESAVLGLLPYAVKNKVPLLFLERALNIYGDTDHLRTFHKFYFEKSQLAINLIEEISRILVQKRINYIFFKTFKPFPFVTVDLDILFFTQEDLLSAYHTLLKQGFKLADYGAYSTSLYSPRHNMIIDLHLEISVSRLVYVNKKLLQEHTGEVNLNGDQVPVLETPASLITVIAHSLYKEQMFTLSDYYTTAIEVSNMTKQQCRTFMDLAEKAHIELSIKTVLALVHSLTKIAFDKTLPAVTKIAEMIEINGVEEKMIPLTLSHFVQSCKLPYRYPSIVVGVAFMTKIFKDPTIRGAIYNQLVELITNKSKFLEHTLLHMRREAY